MGFCFFNNAAVACKYAHATYGELLGLERAAVVVSGSSISLPAGTVFSLLCVSTSSPTRVVTAIIICGCFS